jgi:hypothetical protein
MLTKDPTEELVYYLTQDKRSSFHFGEISLGVKKLLEALKEQGYVVHLTRKYSEPKLLTQEDCAKYGIAFEHKVGNGLFD